MKRKILLRILSLLCVVFILSSNLNVYADVESQGTLQNLTIEPNDRKTSKEEGTKYEYAKEILFWKPTDKFEFTSKVGSSELMDYNKEAVRFYLDDKFKIEVDTDYKYENVEQTDLNAPRLHKYTLFPKDLVTKKLTVWKDEASFRYGKMWNGTSVIKDTLRFYGNDIGWTSGDIIYMVQSKDLNTGEDLEKPIVTMIVMDRERKSSLSPEYNVDDEGNLKIAWQPVEGADAYAIMSYYRMPPKERLEGLVAEINERASASNAEDPVVVDHIEIINKDTPKDKKITSKINYSSKTESYVVDIVDKTEFSLKDAEFYNENNAKVVEKGQNIVMPSNLITSHIPESARYLSIIALKKNSQEAIQEEEELEKKRREELIERLPSMKDFEFAPKPAPNYLAIEESPLYDFNDMANVIPQRVIKHESSYASTEKSSVNSIDDIAEFVYIEMADGTKMKRNLIYADEYEIVKEDWDKTDGKEFLENTLAIKMKVAKTPFSLYFKVKNYNERNPENDVNILKDRLERAFEYRADLKSFTPKAPMININKESKTVTFTIDTNSSSFNEPRKVSKSRTDATNFNISGNVQDGGLQAYSEEERAACLPDHANGSTDFVREIAWAMMTGQRSFHVNYNINANILQESVYEACWQNQYTLEVDYPTYEYIYDGNGTIHTVNFNYMISDINQRKQMQRQMKSKVQEIIGNVNANYSNDMEKLYAFNNYLCDNADYDEYVFENKITNTTSRTAYGVLIEGRGVCTSYARAFQLLIDTTGKTCYVDSGQVSSGGGHAWDIVLTQDGYYMVDPTWNDSTEKNQFLMIPKKVYQTTHGHKEVCLRPEVYNNINFAYNGGSYDYLTYIGRAADINNVANLLKNYGVKGYYPSWIRVYNMYKGGLNYPTREAADYLYDVGGDNVSYSWSTDDIDLGIVYFSAYGLNSIDKGYFEIN